jgi:hypothetical protein
MFIVPQNGDVFTVIEAEKGEGKNPPGDAPGYDQNGIS